MPAANVVTPELKIKLVPVITAVEVAVIVAVDVAVKEVNVAVEVTVLVGVFVGVEDNEDGTGELGTLKLFEQAQGPMLNNASPKTRNRFK